MKKYTALVLALAMALPMGAHAIGAIAVDDVEGDRASDVGYNVVGGFDSESEAKFEAMKACRQAGNRNCKIGVWYTRCGAYASSRRSTGWGTGSTKSAASDNALDSCGDRSCQIVVADCE